MKLFDRIKWIMLVILLLGGAFALWRLEGPKREFTRLGTVVSSELVQRVTIAGIVIPHRTTVITAPYDGYVRKVYVKLGEMIKKGSPVVSVSETLLGGDTVYPIRAPFSGQVVQVAKDEGQFARKGDVKDFLLRIDDLSQKYIQSNVPEVDITKIKQGQEVVIRASAILDRKYKGIVRDISIAATMKEQWGMSQVEFLVRIEVMDPDEELKPGMSVVADIIANRREKVLTLRHEFIHQEGESYYILDSNGIRKRS